MHAAQLIDFVQVEALLGSGTAVASSQSQRSAAACLFTTQFNVPPATAHSPASTQRERAVGAFPPPATREFILRSRVPRSLSAAKAHRSCAHRLYAFMAADEFRVAVLSSQLMH